MNYSRLLAALAVVGSAATPAIAQECLVIGHRGASGYMPEHTLEAYQLAIEQGADYIEPDLVLTKDGVAVARHESRLDGTTDVADLPEFARKLSSRTIRGNEIVGWFSDDFTLAELRKLKARERMPDIRPENKRWNGQFSVPTLAEIIELVRDQEEKTGRVIGIYPELKQPAYFAERGMDIVEIVLSELAEAGYAKATDPVFVQSFEADALRRARENSELRLVQLLGQREPLLIALETEPDSLAALAEYADGIGVPKYGYILTTADANEESLAAFQPTGLVANAHAAGLLVHAYTFREENKFLPELLQSSARAADAGAVERELNLFLDAGIDGFFIDQPDLGRKVCDERAAEGSDSEVETAGELSGE